MPQSASRLVDTSQDYDPSKMTKYEKNQLGIKEPEPEPGPAETQPTEDPAFQPSEALLQMTPEDWQSLTEEQYQKLFIELLQLLPMYNYRY